VSPRYQSDGTLSDGSHDLYVIEHPHGYQKVGISEQTRKRVSGVQTASPYKLSLRTTINVEPPVETERTVHHILDPHHHRREWYELPERVLERLDEVEYLDPGSVRWQLKPCLNECELVQSERANESSPDPDRSMDREPGEQATLTGW